MDFLTIVFLSVALAMDCFAVSVVRGNDLNCWRLVPLLPMALSFGFFQGVMPLIGYASGYLFYDAIEKYDHWIALALLSFIGIRMIVEDLKDEDGVEVSCESDYTMKRILLLSVATSIDALATGLLFLPCPERLASGISMIVFASFGMSLLGCFLGFELGKRLKFKFGCLGGVILILIGVKIVLEHLYL